MITVTSGHGDFRRSTSCRGLSAVMLPVEAAVVVPRWPIVLTR